MNEEGEEAGSPLTSNSTLFGSVYATFFPRHPRLPPPPNTSSSSRRRSKTRHRSGPASSHTYPAPMYPARTPAVAQDGERDPADLRLRGQCSIVVRMAVAIVSEPAMGCTSDSHSPSPRVRPCRTKDPRISRWALASGLYRPPTIAFAIPITLPRPMTLALDIRGASSGDCRMRAKKRRHIDSIMMEIVRPVAAIHPNTSVAIRVDVPEGRPESHGRDDI